MMSGKVLRVRGVISSGAFALAAVLGMGLTDPAQAAGRTYFMDGYFNNCQGGTDEGMIWVGSGKFSIGSTVYERRSGLTNLGNGWVQASYEAWMEGEPTGDFVLQVKAEERSVVIRSAEGEVQGQRCR